MNAQVTKAVISVHDTTNLLEEGDKGQRRYFRVAGKFVSTRVYCRHLSYPIETKCLWQEWVIGTVTHSFFCVCTIKPWKPSRGFLVFLGRLEVERVLREAINDNLGRPLIFLDPDRGLTELLGSLKETS